MKKWQIFFKYAMMLLSFSVDSCQVTFLSPLPISQSS